jgi:hypothetical protein
MVLPLTWVTFTNPYYHRVLGRVSFLLATAVEDLPTRVEVATSTESQRSMDDFRLAHQISALYPNLLLVRCSWLLHAVLSVPILGDSMTPQDLAIRVRGEYAEMPGLSLTRAQAARLWNLDLFTCDALLQTLMRETILTRTSSGTYVAPPR